MPPQAAGKEQGTMTCREFLDSMFEFRRRQLARDEMARCRDHLDHCDHCRQELADTEKFLSAAKACWKRRPLPAGLEARLRMSAARPRTCR